MLDAWGIGVLALRRDSVCWHRPCLDRVALIFSRKAASWLSEENLVILNSASDAGAVGLYDAVHNLIVQIELHT